jgi:hypothetical protein
LAGILTGDQKVDLFDHLCAFKRRPGPTVEKLRGRAQSSTGLDAEGRQVIPEPVRKLRRNTQDHISSRPNTSTALPFDLNLIGEQCSNFWRLGCLQFTDRHRQLRSAALYYPLVVDVGDLVFQFPERLTLTAQPGTAPEVARVCAAGSGVSRAEAPKRCSV